MSVKGDQAIMSGCVNESVNGKRCCAMRQELRSDDQSCD